MVPEAVAELLETCLNDYYHGGFIQDDPISIPHQFSKKQDIEIIGFWTAMLAWGQRKTIINKASELVERMDGSPYAFVLQADQSDIESFQTFKHRTFNGEDAAYFIRFFKSYYSEYESLETLFIDDAPMRIILENFHESFFALPNAPQRTRKHVSTPAKKSACKRLNMFLRWMVRKDAIGVDFGIWNHIPMHKLMIPLDVHVFKVAKSLGLLDTNKADWNAVEELTEQLRRLDKNDPVKYDYALFSMGIHQRHIDLL